jgi:hypothetical protein
VTLHPPDGIAEDHARARTGLQRHGGVLATVLCALVLALVVSGALGHRRSWSARSHGVSLAVRSYDVLRCGELYEMRVTVTTERDLDELGLEVGAELWRGITVNSLTPAAREEASGDGVFSFRFSRLPAGGTFVWQAGLQANPDAHGSRAGVVRVRDGVATLVALALEVEVLP